LIRAVGVANEGHWAGLISHPVTFVVDRAGIVRWIYAGDSASDRPSPLALAKTAVSVAKGKEVSEEK
jgi:peroxiredoxin